MVIKVCGMRNNTNIAEVAALKPDWMGFIFYPKSQRFVGENFDEALPVSVMPEISTVGVFVNEEYEKMEFLAKKYQFDYVQLHGNESPNYCRRIKDEGFKVLKAFGIQAGFDWQSINEYQDACDYFLFDTSTKNYGGSGQKFDWNLLKDYTLPKKFILSGGIGPNDWQVIKDSFHPMMAGIDINSQFETEPGLKNVQALKTFIQNVRH
jgi:phosphoribosylanthranilate isomerase